MSGYAKISAATAATHTLVAGVSGSKIVVTSIFITAAGDVDVYFMSEDTTALIGDSSNGLFLTTHVGYTPINPNGLCETSEGDAFQMVLSAAVGVSGCLTYEVEKV